MKTGKKKPSMGLPSMMGMGMGPMGKTPAMPAGLKSKPGKAKKPKGKC